MTAPACSSSGLEVLLATLKNEQGVESTLYILNVLDELLSAGTDQRIHYMIKKGGSESLLTALVNNGRSFNPNYTILLPLLHLLAKVGHRDRRIGIKAEEAGAVLLTLNLLKHNCNHAKRAAACLWVIQVFSSSVHTANLIGENHGLDIIYHLIPQYTTKHWHTIRAAINAFSALLCTKANLSSALSKGYISGLLWLYEDWHNKDTHRVAIAIRHSLLCCFHMATNSAAGRQAFTSHGGIRLLYETTQSLSKSLECLVEPSVQLMRKCLPKTRLPLTSDHSAYTFPLPERPHVVPDVDPAPDQSSEESDLEDTEETCEADSRDYDDDLETDLNKFRVRPDPDRPKELLQQYSCLCPELSHDFQELDVSSEPGESSTAASSSDEEDAINNTSSPSSSRSCRIKSSGATASSDLPHPETGKGSAPEAMVKEAMEEVEECVKVGGHHIQAVKFADNQAMIANSAEGLHTIISQLNDVVERYKMKINKNLEQVQQFKYLGSLMTEDRRSKTAIKARITMAKAPVQLETSDFHSQNSILSTSPGFRTIVGETMGEMSLGQREDDQSDDEGSTEESHVNDVIKRLLGRHGTPIPNHEPNMYCAAASKTKSIPGFSILAFPDFWGHLPPSGHEPMALRKPNIQRQKVLEDVKRFVNTDDIFNRVVFDLEESSLQCPSDSLSFFSQFECGNLRKAIQVRKYEYDLILNADVNCSQHAQWFYFEVSNMATEVPYRFNIINCEKSNSQFNYGMQPVLYSVREALEGRPQWIRSGSEICYFRNHFCPAQGKRKATFYTLTFTITFKHQEDVCYLAYHYPYTYSALKAHLKVLQKSVDRSKVFFREQILCSSLAGNICPLVTVTACPASRSWKDLHQLRKRPCIVLTGRVHPGESNASWVMKGTLEFLCSSDPVAQSLREAFVFKIIPMLNPDGVINGTNRCDLNSEDLNRQWCNPDPVLSPTIYHTKGFLYYLNSTGRTPLVFCDYHGHSRKKNVFLYGCSMKETLWQSGSPVDTIGLKEDPGYRTIPKTLDRIAPAFSFNSCNFLVEKSRSATARVVVWREMGVLRSYTMESTYNGCNLGIYKGLQIGTTELQEMGFKFCHSLLSVTYNIRTLYTRRLITHIDLDPNVLDHNSFNCFEDDEPPCAEAIEYSTNCPSLKGSDLDSDVNTNMASDYEDESTENQSIGKHHQVCSSQSQKSSTKDYQLPSYNRQATIEALSEKRNLHCGVSISNGQITS
ncbi:cytosolic carboxypeptidase 4 [Pholidichthys leucotaenia]